ncbi:MAG: hypothetical protein L3K19_00185 [Thermoplasmata archaeon]|nr:hypothetical protein [Thermoplasmata archaeon]
MTSDSSLATKQSLRQFIRHLEVLLVELTEQCHLCMLAFAELERFAKRVPPASDDGRRDWNRMTWSRVQAVLSASSAISHLLWPNPSPGRDATSRERTKLRGKALRQHLGIRGEPPIYQRAVRNAFEHVDERLDDWVPTVLEAIPLGWCIACCPLEEEDLSMTKDAFRYVNLYTMDVRVAGETCNLENLADYAAWVRARIPLETGVVLKRIDAR